MQNIKLIFLATGALLAGCVSNAVVSTNPNSPSATGNLDGYESFSITSIDLGYAANKAVQQFLEAPESIKPGGGRYVIVVDQVVNDTLNNFDIRRLTAQIKRKLRQSNRFRFSNALGADQTRAVLDERKLQDSKLFDQSTVAQDGTLAAPDLYLTGKIVVATTRSADGDRQQLNYAFMLEVVDKVRGYVLFDSYVEIDKTGSNKNFAW
ncbi:conserved hypothetical protein [Magnetococcus marinus MC-1]|uniref:Penicillin-binding protein activator LpoB n=1 Tax=Magnetococcus marinus (strain ATCC BAA-1437 / JCM 17883 / MC-1) TaxID=156889 RepID=A0LBE2_MAGMM|nr:penicillin-binding protein activator LpoB [Magnetococcus marinus]ABK45285.1 conserved hypothetical protein [Magnetococcus marinus MC-1]